MAAKETCFTDPSNYVNRELSWLEFDHRVIDNEAAGSMERRKREGYF